MDETCHVDEFDDESEIQMGFFRALSEGFRGKNGESGANTLPVIDANILGIADEFGIKAVNLIFEPYFNLFQVTFDAEEGESDIQGSSERGDRSSLKGF
jgi:hypothetical protein